MDKFFEFLKLINKIIEFPQMSLTERENELIKEVLSETLDNNPNYGPITKRDFKILLENSNNYLSLYCELEAYAKTHNLSL